MAQAVENASSAAEKGEREVLPSNITPKHYFVSLTPDLVKHFKFFGRAEIDVTIKEKCSHLTLNAFELTFTKVEFIQNKNTTEIAVDSVVFNKEREEASFKLPENVETGDARLCIEFVGTLADNMKGFYRSKYVRSNGEEAYCGVTQFESTDARRSFPCWDEPACKATFTVELTVPNDLVAISNMPEADKKIVGNVKTVTFEKSPVMSTYLLAWFIGEFEYVEAKTSRDIIVRVWTAIGKKNQGQFACQTACKCLDFYEKYFDIKYPLPKCDMVAVPDFAAGAMENWGLITYREIALLADKDKASVRQLRYVAIVVCHELAHQWFGNLVTMEWWSQLWLNEGFACFMEYLSSDAIFPDWPMWNLFITSEYSRAFELDGMATSHPIEVDVLTARAAEEVFDAISYCKGAAVIRMLQSFLGAEVFRSALTKYLNNFQYSNAVTTDLWDFLSKESGKPVASIMQSWTREQGFPLITATRKGGKITLTQTRYLASGQPTEEQKKVVWNIPITMRVDGGKEVIPILLDSRSKTFDVSSEAGWVHLNADSTGFYAVQYDRSMMDQLTTAIGKLDAQLSTIDKVTLVRDTAALAEAGVDGATENLLALLLAFTEDVTYPVWDAILTAAGSIRHIIDTDEDIATNFNCAMRGALSTLYNKVGWDAKPNEDADVGGLLRPLLLGSLSKFEHSAAIDEAKKRFTAFMKAPHQNADVLHPSLRASVYAIAVKFGGREEFQTLKEYYNTTEDAAEKSWALRSLGYVRDPKLISELLQWILDSDEVRNQDKVFPFRTVANTLAGRQLAFTFLQDNFDKWYKLFDGGFMVQHLVKIPSAFVTDDKADEVEKYYSDKDYPSANRSMKQCVETIRKNAKWRNQSIKLIAQWAANAAKQ